MTRIGHPVERVEHLGGPGGGHVERGRQRIESRVGGQGSGRLRAGARPSCTGEFLQRSAASALAAASPVSDPSAVAATLTLGSACSKRSVETPSSAATRTRVGSTAMAELAVGLGVGALDGLASATAPVVPAITAAAATPPIITRLVMMLLPRHSVQTRWSAAAELAAPTRRIPVYALGHDSSRTAAVTPMSCQVSARWPGSKSLQKADEVR